MTEKETRRNFLKNTAAAALAGATAGAAAACRQEATSQTETRDGDSMVDFDRSYFMWTSKPYVPHPHYANDGGMVQGEGSVRDVRILYEALCTITNHLTGHVEELFLLHPCLAEMTIPKKDFFLLPSYEFRVIFSRTHQIPIAKRPSAELQTRQAAPHRFETLRFTTRAFPRFSTLRTAPEVIEATLAGKPLNVRSSYRDPAGRYTVSLQYPVRTMNLNPEEKLFQVDTGPVPFPDMQTWDGERPLWASLSFVAFSDFDFSEFILRREVEPSAEDKKWLHRISGKWRWDLRDPKNSPAGHPPRHPWPFVYNETRVLATHNEFLCADLSPGSVG